jgi:glycosyltransferase involved in cell wall biosynthesis
MKVLTLVSSGLGLSARGELVRASDQKEHPRIELFEKILNSDILDESGSIPKGLPTANYSRFIPKQLSQVITAYRLRDEYDAFISWSEKRTILLATVLKLTHTRVPHIALMYWMSRPAIAVPLSIVHTSIDRIVTWSTVQRNFAIKRLGIPAPKIDLVPHPVDQLFWMPSQGKNDIISAVGSEMRDYVTLVEAIRGLDIFCHIASGGVRIIGKFSSRTIDPSKQLKNLPANVVIRPLTPQELRGLYSRSRFVVVPLLPSDTDNGVNTILEAMAMRKAVICSRTEGQVDVIQDGKTGIYVPPGDVAALRNAIKYLWDNPSVAQKMGENGRAYVEQNHTLDGFANAVKGIVQEVIGKKNARLVD